MRVAIGRASNIVETHVSIHRWVAMGVGLIKGLQRVLVAITSFSVTDRATCVRFSPAR
jgi:hypothetical protein